MNSNDIYTRVAKYDPDLAREIVDYISDRDYGLIYEASKPEFVRLYRKPVVVGDYVNILPPRGTMEDSAHADESDVVWSFLRVRDDKAELLNIETGETTLANLDDLVTVARFDQRIYAGLRETGRVERGGDKPYHVVINGENFHALQTLMYPYEHRVDCIYIDPPYNTGAKDWKYNNDYVGPDDGYRHSKWLTFMEDRLKLAQKLLNPNSSVLIVTIDEKEYLRLGLLLEQMFDKARIQMVSCMINPGGVSRQNAFSRTDEYIYFVMFGDAIPTALRLSDEWLGGVKSTSKLSLHWDSLLRTGTNNMRTDRPNLFYPVFVSEDGKRFLGVGESLALTQDRSTVVVPKGQLAIFPMHSDGSEGCWQIEQKTLQAIQREHCVKLGGFTKYGMAISYLKAGQRNKVTSGEFEVIGYADDGSYIVDDRNYRPSFRPGTQWMLSSHDATRNGSGLLRRIFGDKRFDFPKSLYAVEDTLRFFLADKPNALVLDFFAGSGTTAHAVMRLNHQDEGARRSIMVTNNEISFEESKKLIAQGLRQGDDEWEALGIARNVTIPRITSAITGCTPSGEPIKGIYALSVEEYQEAEYDVFDTETGKKVRGKLYKKVSGYTKSVPDNFPMADGFEENAIFFDLEYVEPSIVRANLAFNEIAPLLWMRAGSVGPMITLDDDPDDATYAITDSYGVLFDYAYVTPFIRECSNRKLEHIFVVTDVDAEFRSVCAEFKGKDVKQLYKSYLSSFEIGRDR